MSSPAANTHVIAMPYPGRGHINPMLNLCRLLASNGISITFVVTKEWSSLLSSSSSSSPLPPNLQLLAIPNVLPSEHVRGADFDGFFEAALTVLAPPFDQVLDELERPPDGILADAYLHWAVAAGGRRGIPVFLLWPESALMLSVSYQLDMIASENPLLPDRLLSDEAEKCVDVPGVTSMNWTDLPSFYFNPKIMALIQEALKWVPKAQCLLLCSIKELEPQTIATINSKLSLPLLPIGPSIAYMTLQDKPLAHSSDYLTWLDSQPRSSVLYLALGSFLSVSASQMDEIARALQASSVRYLWVVRGTSPKTGTMTASGLGLIVPWCDQLKVLCHASVGGFFTHCGWNSTLEAIYAGLPMLCFPLLLDQFTNCKLIVDEWKVGLRMRRQGEEEIVRSEEIAKFMRMMMDLDGEESRGMRRRVRDLQVACHGALENGGSSFANISAFIKDLKAHN